MRLEARHILPFLLGAATAATVALLTTNKTGRERRLALAEGLDDLKETMTGAVGGQVTKAGVGIAAAGRSVQRTGTRLQE
jgi:hypothetical protein